MSSMKMVKWSDEEVEFLRKNYENYKIGELAKRLNRSFYSVKRKLEGLKIHKGFKFCKGCPVKWGEKEKSILLEYKDKSIRKISRILKKTEPQIRYAIRKFKIERRDRYYWSERELSLLKDYINKPYSVLKKHLPNRSIEAIIGKKNKLKLRRRSDFYWSDEANKYLIQNYHKKPIDELSRYLEKSHDAIHARRIRLIKDGFFIKDKKEFFSRYWKKQYKVNKKLMTKHGEAINNLWDNKNFRKRHKESILKMFKDKNFLEEHKRKFLERRNSDDFKRKQIRVASRVMKLRHKNPDEHRKILANLRRNPSNQQLYAWRYLRSKLREGVVCNDWGILDGLMEVDISLKRSKIAVEWDGSYWHKGRNANKKENKKNDLLISKGWKFIRVNDPQLSRDEIEYRCDVILWLIEKYKNSNYFKYTGGFYI